MAQTTQTVRRAGDILNVDLADSSGASYLHPEDRAREWRSDIASAYGCREIIFSANGKGLRWLNGVESELTAPADHSWEPWEEVYTPPALAAVIERENRAAFEVLIPQLRSPMGVVPFVGAGLSVSFGFPSWQKFLTDASEFHRRPQDVIKLINEGDYLGAAGKLYEEDPDRFQLMVAQAFGSEVSQEQACQGPASLLPTLARGPVITTNFDHVLEVAFQAAGRPFDFVITGPQPDSVVRVMHRNELALIKIHGDAFDRSARVFTGQEYETQYPKRPNAPSGDTSLLATGSSALLPTVSKLARIMFTNRPLLFLGCSLDRDRTLNVLKMLHAEVPGLTHYAVLGASYRASTLRNRRRELGDFGIVPLWFAPGDYAGIERLLRQLIQDASTRVVWKGGPRPQPASPNHQTPLPAPPEIPRDARSCDGTDAIVRRLARKIVQGKLTFFLGSGAHLTSILGARAFYTSLAQDYEFDEKDSQRAEVAQFIADREGKAELWAAAKSQLQSAASSPSVVYRFLSALPKLLRCSGQDAAAHQYIFTTNYDTVLEQSFSESAELFHLLYYQADGKDEGRFLHRALDGTIRAIEVPSNIKALEGAAHVVTKLDGGIPWDEHLVQTVAISPMDFSVSAGRLPAALPKAVSDILRGRSLLVLGSSLRDVHVQRLIRWSTEGTGVLKTWAVQNEVSPNARKYWEAARVQLVECDLGWFIPALWAQVQAFLDSPNPV